MNRFLRHIIGLALTMQWVLPTTAQNNVESQTLMPGETPKPTKYISVEEEKEHLVFFQGFTLSADVYGPVAYMVSDYGTLEGALRLNLKNTFFPTFEAGVGKCIKDDFNTKIKYKVSVPFARVGIDFNMLKDKFQSNRLYLGARYGISIFKYDMSGPAMIDPIWGGSEAFSMNNLNCTSHWAELVLGVEVSIIKNFHMGWSVRYKRELSSTKSDFAKPSCIPGYGYTTNETCWGATYSLIFDLNWGMKKSHKRGVNLELRDLPTEDPAREENTDKEENTDNLQEDENNGEGSEEESEATETI